MSSQLSLFLKPIFLPKKVNITAIIKLANFQRTVNFSGLGVTVPEEIALKWYELVQTELPMCALSAIFGPLPLSVADKRFLLSDQIPWGIACGKASAFFMNIYFEHEFESDINEMRRKYRISVAPTVNA